MCRQLYKMGSHPRKHPTRLARHHDQWLYRVKLQACLHLLIHLILSVALLLHALGLKIAPPLLPPATNPQNFHFILQNARFSHSKNTAKSRAIVGGQTKMAGKALGSQNVFSMTTTTSSNGGMSIDIFLGPCAGQLTFYESSCT